MTVKLHKVTVFVIDSSIPGDDEGDGLAKLQGDMYHNSGSRIVDIQTAEFDREWSDDDPLNKTTTMDNRALLESLISLGFTGKPIPDHISQKLVNDVAREQAALKEIQDGNVS